VDALCTEGEFAAKSQLIVGLSIDPAEGSLANILNGLATIGISPTVYSHAQVAAGQPVADGVTVLIVSRVAVVSAVNDSYIAGIRGYIAQGGSVLAEYDGAALMFRSFQGLNVAFQGHMLPSYALFAGNVAGGGLLLPLTQSVASVTNASHPIMQGVNTTITSGLRTAFAVSQHDTNFLDTLATFNSTGSSGSIPAGTFPAVMATRCGGGRIAMYQMNHLSGLATPSVATMISNTFHWLVGDTN
jgi:hypothetical protein